MKIIYKLKQKMIEFVRRFQKGIIKAYMFHEISDTPLSGDRYNINPDLFKSFIVNIDKNKIISIKDMRAVKSKSVLLTFDDAFLSAYISAFPILIENNIPFAVFISPSLIGKEGYISEQHLISLSNEKLCTIGYHTYSHPMLRYLDQNEMIYEISTSKKLLESIIKKKISAFAYPYGSILAVSQKAIDITKKSDYNCAFSTIRGDIKKTDLLNDNLFFLPRINVTENYIKKVYYEK